MTTDAKHTPEPWTKGPARTVYAGDDRRIGQFLREVDLERALACVRACAGIPTEQLEKACVEKLVRALLEISSPSQTTGLLWWQKMAREALAPFDKD